MDANYTRTSHTEHADITVPLGMMAGREHESLRSPPELSRAEILRRLVEIREFDVTDAGRFFSGVESMSPAQLGAAVIGALNWVQDHPAHPFVAEQIQLVALNLRNLDSAGGSGSTAL